VTFFGSHKKNVIPFCSFKIKSFDDPSRLQRTDECQLLSLFGQTGWIFQEMKSFGWYIARRIIFTNSLLRYPASLVSHVGTAIVVY
jgi:hypothetical protein